MLEDALACTCYGSIWAVESAADIPTMLCWHGTIAGSGISKKTVALGPCGSWRTESYNEGVFPFRLHHHHHHHHPVAALGSYADSWRATTSMNCCSWALRQLEDSKRVYSLVIIMWPLLDPIRGSEGYRDGDYDDN